MSEFTYGGAVLTAPADLPDPGAEAAPGAGWDAHVYLRDNPAGPHRELWYHAAACRQWFEVTRDTRTNDLLAEASA